MLASPYTLNPTRYPLHSFPHTLYPTRCTPHADTPYPTQLATCLSTNPPPSPTRISPGTAPWLSFFFFILEFNSNISALRPSVLIIFFLFASVVELFLMRVLLDACAT